MKIYLKMDILPKKYYNPDFLTTSAVMRFLVVDNSSSISLFLTNK
jgi:hypothetical protein